MTANQIAKAFKNAGISTDGMEFKRDEVEIFVDNGEGRADEAKTDEAMERFERLFQWGGFTTGYGSRILRAKYESLGDWNDRTSRHHY